MQNEDRPPGRVAGLYASGVAFLLDFAERPDRAWRRFLSDGPGQSEDKRMDLLRWVLLTASVLIGSGCSAVASYAKDRALDFVDIINVKYGSIDEVKMKHHDINNSGIGFMLQATQLAGAIVGAGGYHIEEFAGRRKYSDVYWGFGFGIAGLWAEGASFHGGRGYFYLGGLNIVQLTDWDEPWNGRPLKQRFRVGGDLWVGPLYGGLYFNLFETLDLLVGIVGLDISNDDGVQWGAPPDYLEWNGIAGKSEAEGTEPP